MRRSPLIITQSRRVRKSTKLLFVCVAAKFVERSYLNLTGEGAFQKVLEHVMECIVPVSGLSMVERQQT